MTEITYEYLNKLASQTINISALLAGFSIAIIANLLVSESISLLSKRILICSTLAACFFLITVFSMTKLLLMTTNGYPIKVVAADLLQPRIVGVISLYLGIISLLLMIALAGWTKSKKMGIFTTIVGILTLIMILVMTA